MKYGSGGNEFAATLFSAADILAFIAPGLTVRK
jgi:hypothetical protein